MEKTSTVYGKSSCQFCDLAKKLLEKYNYKVNYIDLDDEKLRKEFYERISKELNSSVMSVPQIWLRDSYVGSYNKLVEYLKEENKISFDKDF